MVEARFSMIYGMYLLDLLRFNSLPVCFARCLEIQTYGKHTPKCCLFYCNCYETLPILYWGLTVDIGLPLYKSKHFHIFWPVGFRALCVIIEDIELLSINCPVLIALVCWNVSCRVDYSDNSGFNIN